MFSERTATSIRCLRRTPIVLLQVEFNLIHKKIKAMHEPYLDTKLMPELPSFLEILFIWASDMCAVFTCLPSGVRRAHVAAATSGHGETVGSR